MYTRAQIAQAKLGQHHIALYPGGPTRAYIVTRVRGDRVLVTRANANEAAFWLNNTASALLVNDHYRGQP